MENKNDKKSLFEQIIDDLFYPETRKFGIQNRYELSIFEGFEGRDKKAAPPEEQKQRRNFFSKFLKIIFFCKYNPEKDESRSRVRYRVTEELDEKIEKRKQQEESP